MTIITRFPRWMQSGHVPLVARIIFRYGDKVFQGLARHTPVSSQLAPGYFTVYHSSLPANWLVCETLADETHAPLFLLPSQLQRQALGVTNTAVLKIVPLE